LFSFFIFQQPSANPFFWSPNAAVSLIFFFHFPFFLLVDRKENSFSTSVTRIYRVDGRGDSSRDIIDDDDVHSNNSNNNDNNDEKEMFFSSFFKVNTMGKK